jgi:peptidoglycan/LPS O-acetylase OafA/YrhL
MGRAVGDSEILHGLGRYPMLKAAHPGDNFDALRLLAAVVVVYGHSFPISGAVSPGILGNPVQTLAVKVFFVVSGFLVIESWRRDRSWVRYLWRRGLRIFPGLFMCIFLSTLVLGPLVTSIPLEEYFKNPWFARYFGNLALYPSYTLPGVFDRNVYPNALNGSLWTLPVEFLMYLVSPFVIAWVKVEKFAIVLASLVVCALAIYVVRLYPSHDPIVFYGTSLTYTLDVAPYFFLGAAWRIVAPMRVYHLQAAFLSVLLLAVLPEKLVPYEIGAFVVLPYAILSFALAKPALFGAIGRIGDLSYGVYIYGFPIQQLVSYFFHTGGKPYLNFLMAIIPTMTLAAVSWHFMERRLLSFKPRRESSLELPGTSVTSDGLAA